eukprot:GHVP01043796.1.p1 GENE.GHVP01043796.1~~GHVP01043796.1.p1  ORF type:complete len:186 (+),score=40.73 GHVP01043796.1:19-576(+)
MQQRTVQKERISYHQHVNEIPEIEYVEVLKEKIVEVPEVQERVVEKLIPVDEIVQVPTPVVNRIEVPIQIDRFLPRAVESTVKETYTFPKVTPKYNVKKVTIRVPRFIEVPVPISFMDKGQLQDAEWLSGKVASLANRAEDDSPSLADLESLANTCQEKSFEFIEDNETLEQLLRSRQQFKSTAF